MTSVYELTTPFGTERKQRFWDWWSTWEGFGTGTFAMVDASNEGFSIKSPVSNYRGTILYSDTGNFRQFSNTASGVISSIKRVSGDTFYTAVGLSREEISTERDFYVTKINNPASSAIYFSTANASAVTDTSITPTSDTDWHTTAMYIFSSYGKMYFDGDLSATSTATLPSIRLQPSFMVNALTGVTVASEGRIRYLECFNT
jgi:hypothetical protein